MLSVAAFSFTTGSMFVVYEAIAEELLRGSTSLVSLKPSTISFPFLLLLGIGIIQMSLQVARCGSEDIRKYGSGFAQVFIAFRL